ncbi:MAG: alpha/beta fold hydrolase [Lawsonella sp.]
MTNRVFKGAVAALSALALTAGVGLSTANAAPYNKYPHQISGMKAPQAKYIENTFTSADGTKINYKLNDVPNEKGQVVVAHGLVEHSGRYDYVTYRLNMAGFDVWRMDHRGHGKSAEPYNKTKKGNVDDFGKLVDDMNTVVKMARKVADAKGQKVIMLGHSMGAIAVQHYSTKYPEGIDLAVSNGGGIAYNPYGGELPPVKYITPKNLPKENLNNEKTIQEKLPFIIEASGFNAIAPVILDKAGADTDKIQFTSPKPLQEATLDNALGDYVCSDEVIRNDYGKDPLNGTSFTLSTGLQMGVSTIYATYNAPKWTKPTLIMHGADDYIVPLYWDYNWYTALHSKDKSMVVWNGLYHETMNEPVRDQVIDYVINWVNARI